MRVLFAINYLLEMYYKLKIIIIKKTFQKENKAVLLVW